MEGVEPNFKRLHTHQVPDQAVLPLVVLGQPGHAYDLGGHLPGHFTILECSKSLGQKNTPQYHWLVGATRVKDVFSSEQHNQHNMIRQHFRNRGVGWF